MAEFWSYEGYSSVSFVWKHLLKLIKETSESIMYKVGNGHEVSLWFVDWLVRGSLAYRPGFSVAAVGYNMHMSVGDILHNSRWNFPTTSCFQAQIWREISQTMINEDSGVDWVFLARE